MFLEGHFLFTCSDTSAVGYMYHLATMHSITDGQTDRETTESCQQLIISLDCKYKTQNETSYPRELECIPFAGEMHVSKTASVAAKCHRLILHRHYNVTLLHRYSSHVFVTKKDTIIYKFVHNTHQQ